ncbi:hypothetical protein JGU66_28560 [Myxococcaceae bacterium JPH2]|nr:hypothetical protein [Myxococcaceae bacterium JPH2]
MFDHFGLRVKNLNRSISLDQAVLTPSGDERCNQDATSAGFEPKGQPALWRYSASEAQ